eukprot:comp22126_c0_seq1/m.32364 comp22126_c0_seq1/g.32364  ORF comp22126_c0_seq1/g.32364 comp22126_c0_seq1/m.32364 type:complete len:128 (-) comp22126_c0_seq1:411-794(-)
MTAHRLRPLAGRLHATDRFSAFATQMFHVPHISEIHFAGGVHKAHAAAAASHHAAASASGGGLVMRPNLVPVEQAYFQNNPHGVPIYQLGKSDALVNKVIGGLSVVAVVCVLYGIGSMAVGANKKKN